MSRRIILSPDARAQLDAAARWYSRKEINLPRRFRAEVQSTLLGIARYPYAYVRIDAAVRRACMNRFRYYIYFRFNAERVLVTGIIHQRRADTVWKDRIDNFGGRSDD